MITLFNKLKKKLFVISHIIYILNKINVRSKKFQFNFTLNIIKLF